MKYVTFGLVVVGMTILGMAAYGDSHPQVGPSIPDPSKLYAFGSSLAVLAVAGWYIGRRR